jgi:hypothetical protein
LIPATPPTIKKGPKLIKKGINATTKNLPNLFNDVSLLFYYYFIDCLLLLLFYGKLFLKIYSLIITKKKAGEQYK